MVPKAFLQWLFVVALAAIALWAINQFPAMDPTLKKVLWVCIIVAVALYTLLLIAGLLGVSMGWR